jgi:hypothetical protein
MINISIIIYKISDKSTTAGIRRALPTREQTYPNITRKSNIIFPLQGKNKQSESFEKFPLASMP